MLFRLVLLLFLLGLAPALAQLPAGFVQRQIARNLNPTTLTFSPNGRLFVAEKDGKIREVVNDVLAPDLLMTVPNVDTFNERGLSGLCFHPDFPRTPFFYVYYTVKDRDQNRLSRFRVTNGVADPKSETVLLEFDKLLGNIHNAGKLQFGPDRKLYVSVGDGSNAAAAQSLSSFLGKILRLNDDGSIPANNPFVGQATGTYRAIYALGFRNPFSLDINPVSGQIYVGDVGSDFFEEVNDVRPGRNYGWPRIEGNRTNQEAPANYTDPLYTYDHDTGCAITGLAVYNPPTIRFPTEYRGRVFFADYCAGYIRMIDPESGRLIGNFATDIDRPVAIATSPDGYLYYLARAGRGGGSQQDNTSTWNGSLHKITFLDSGLPYVTKQSAGAFVPVGESVTLTVDAVGQKPLTYRWYRNGQLLNGANQSAYTFSSPTLADNGASFRCIVSNALGADTTAVMPLRVVQGQRPVVRIRQPLTSATYRAGDVIAYAGEAVNANQQPLPDAKLTWWINFHHEDHFHPALDPVTGPGSGTYKVPRVGETSTNVWYRVHLRATDASGLTADTYVDVKPELVFVTVTSNPTEARLVLDTEPHQTDFAFEAVVGTLHTIETKPYVATPAGFYKFLGWSNGQKPTTITYEIPPKNATLSMAYEPLPSPGGSGFWAGYFDNVQEINGAPTLVRTDPTINFDWNDGSPSPRVSTDNFAVRWTGRIQPPLTDTYTFHTETDDGIRLWVNNKLLIDKWNVQPEAEWTAKIDLVAGRQYDVRMEYFENQGVALARLLWSSPQFEEAIVNKGQVFPVQLVTATYPSAEGNLTVFPNPAHDQTIVHYNALKSGTAQLGVTDLLGRRVYTASFRFSAGPNDYPILVADWPTGLYQVAIKPTDQPAVYRRLLVR